MHWWEKRCVNLTTTRGREILQVSMKTHYALTSAPLKQIWNLDVLIEGNVIAAGVVFFNRCR
jgi:hypothetical protein